MIDSVGFTGTQKGMTPDQYRVVSNLIGEELRPRHVHHGDCIGADAEFHEIAEYFEQIIIHTHPPSDPKKRAYCIGQVNYAPAPYLKRNRAIVAMADVLIAAPKDDNQNKVGSGTWTTIDYARQRGIPIFIVYPDGTCVSESGNAASGDLSAKSGLTSQ